MLLPTRIRSVHRAVLKLTPVAASVSTQTSSDHPMSNSILNSRLNFMLNSLITNESNSLPFHSSLYFVCLSFSIFVFSFFFPFASCWRFLFHFCTFWPFLCISYHLFVLVLSSWLLMSGAIFFSWPPDVLHAATTFFSFLQLGYHYSHLSSIHSLALTPSPSGVMWKVWSWGPSPGG